MLCFCGVHLRGAIAGQGRHTAEGWVYKGPPDKASDPRASHICLLIALGPCGRGASVAGPLSGLWCGQPTSIRQASRGARPSTRRREGRPTTRERMRHAPARKTLRLAPAQGVVAGVGKAGAFGALGVLWFGASSPRAVDTLASPECLGGFALVLPRGGAHSDPLVRRGLCHCMVVDSPHVAWRLPPDPLYVAPQTLEPLCTTFQPASQAGSQ